jgi:hypothetical protein
MSRVEARKRDKWIEIAGPGPGTSFPPSSTSGGFALLSAIEEAKKKLRAPAKQDALRLLRNSVVERWEMVEYPAALAKG